MKCKNCKNYTFPNASSKSLAMGMCAAYKNIEEASSYLYHDLDCRNGNFKQADKEQIEDFEQMHNLRDIMISFSYREGNHYAIIGSEQYNKERVINSLNRLHQKKKVDTIAVSNKKGVAEYAREWAIDNNVSLVRFKTEAYAHSDMKVYADILSHLDGLKNDDGSNIGVVVFGDDNFDMIMKCNQTSVKVWEVDG